MKIVLDTHIILHAAADALSEKRSALLEVPSNELYISAVSLWEITKLSEFGYATFDQGFEHFMRSLCAHPRYAIVPYSADLMITLGALAPKLHKDPADQLIAATAVLLGASLMTDDGKLKKAKVATVV